MSDQVTLVEGGVYWHNPHGKFVLVGHRKDRNLAADLMFFDKLYLYSRNDGITIHTHKKIEVKDVR